MKHKINDLMDLCHGNARAAGWWTDKEGNDLTLNPMRFSSYIALTHAELSEALECDRKDLMDEKLPHRHGREVELADVIIRVMDLAGAYNMDIGGAVMEKLEFNKVRKDHKKEVREATGGKAY